MDSSRRGRGLQKRNYPAKTAILFKATSKVMESQRFPMPYVVFLCDAYEVISNRRGEEARSEMSPPDERF
jgi:hypothetical protein